METLFGYPSIANTIFIQVRVRPRATIVALVAAFIRALVFAIRNAVTIAIRVDQEARPRDTAEAVSLRNRAGFVSPNRFRIAIGHVRTVMRESTRHTTFRVLLCHSEVTTDLKVEVRTDMEHETHRGFVHRHRFETFVVAIKDVHIVFTEDGNDRKRIDFDTGSHIIEAREIIVTHRETVAAVQVDENRSGFDLTHIHRCCENKTHDRVLVTVSVTNARISIDIIRFADPKTALVRVRRREIHAEEQRDIKKLIFRKRCTELQAGAEITEIALICGVASTRFLAFFIGILIKTDMVIIKRKHYRYVHNFEHAKGHAEVAVCTIIFRHAVTARVRIELFVRENALVIRDIAQNADTQLTMLHGLC